MHFRTCSHKNYKTPQGSFLLFAPKRLLNSNKVDIHLSQENACVTVNVASNSKFEIMNKICLMLRKDHGRCTEIKFNSG